MTPNISGSSEVPNFNSAAEKDTAIPSSDVPPQTVQQALNQSHSRPPGSQAIRSVHMSSGLDPDFSLFIFRGDENTQAASSSSNQVCNSHVLIPYTDADSSYGNATSSATTPWPNPQNNDSDADSDDSTQAVSSGKKRKTPHPADPNTRYLKKRLVAETSDTEKKAVRKEVKQNVPKENFDPTTNKGWIKECNQLFEQGRFQKKNQEFDNSIRTHNRIVKIVFKSLNHKKKYAAAAYSEICANYIAKGELLSATRYFKQAESICKELLAKNFDPRCAEIYGMALSNNASIFEKKGETLQAAGQYLASLIQLRKAASNHADIIEKYLVRYLLKTPPEGLVLSETIESLPTAKEQILEISEAMCSYGEELLSEENFDLARDFFDLSLKFKMLYPTRSKEEFDLVQDLLSNIEAALSSDLKDQEIIEFFDRFQSQYPEVAQLHHSLISKTLFQAYFNSAITAYDDYQDCQKCLADIEMALQYKVDSTEVYSLIREILKAAVGLGKKSYYEEDYKKALEAGEKALALIKKIPISPPKYKPEPEGFLVLVIEIILYQAKALYRSSERQKALESLRYGQDLLSRLKDKGDWHNTMYQYQGKLNALSQSYRFLLDNYG